MTDPRLAYRDFYDNPAIQSLAREFRWTVSGQIGEDDPEDPTKRATRKAPIDLRHLLEGGNLRGAWALDDTCLLSLDELAERLPLAANAAFYLQACTDGLLVIDIEPACPPEIAANLLALPGLLYSELSMSGRGYHLVAALPPNFHAFPNATGKRVLREEHGWYEILLEHWVTFTRQPIGDHSGVAPQPVLDAPFQSVADLYASLAALAKETSAVSPTAVATDGANMPEIPSSTEIIRKVLSTSTPALKSLADFKNDHSRWEFSVLSRLYSRMLPELTTYGEIYNITYTDSDRAWLLYSAAIEIIPPRHKHHERRNGRPFLLDRAATLVAERKHRDSDNPTGRNGRRRAF